MNFSEEVKTALWDLIDEIYYFYGKSVLEKRTP